jgi:hypothetical protein
LIEGAYFFPGKPDAVTGSATLGSFVRIQNSTSEQGYNTGVTTAMPDVKAGASFHFADFKVPANPGGTVNGIAYYSFALDINEGPSSQSLISLDKLQFFVRGFAFDSSPTNSGNTYFSLTNSATKVYDMDANGDRTLLLDGSLVGGGTSTVDLVMLVPQSVFAPYSSTSDNVFLYFQMGATGTSGGASYTSDGNYEEWNAVSGLTFTIPAQVPEPGTWGAIAVMTLAGVATWRSQKRKRQSVPEPSSAGAGHRLEDSVTGSPAGSLGPCPR